MATRDFVSLWDGLGERIEKLSRKQDELWLKRHRKQNTKTVALGVFELVLSRGSLGYSGALRRLANRAQSEAVAASSFCEARGKISDDFFRRLQQQILSDVAVDDDSRWHGHRVFAIDGTKITLPRELTRAGFPVPNNGYYPQGLLSVLFHVRSQLPYDVRLTSDGDERASAAEHLETLGSRDLVIYDRGYFSYSLLISHFRCKVSAVFRLPRRGTYPVIEKFWRSRCRDQIVTLMPATDKGIRRFRKRHPGTTPRPIRLRLVKYTVRGVTYCLATTLVDKTRYPRRNFGQLYHSRWSIEELYKVNKRLLALESFHSRNEQGVRQELFAHFCIVTLCRALANCAEKNLSGTADSTHFQVNFTYVVSIFSIHYLQLFLPLRRHSTTQLLDDISHCRFRRRPGRHFMRKSRRPFRRWMPPAHVSQPA
jgi:Transposase DDE domain